MFFNKAKRRAKGVLKGKCPYCGRAMDQRKGYGGVYYNSCNRCFLDMTTKVDYYTNYFEEYPTEYNTDKIYTEKLTYSELKGDWYTMPDQLRETLKYLNELKTTVKVAPDDPKFYQMISDGKKLINNVCPICNGEIKKYKRFCQGNMQNVTKLVRTGYGEYTLKNEYEGSPDTTMIFYQCPQQHGSYDLEETCKNGIYSKKYSLRSYENLADYQIERLKKASAFSYINSKTKKWEDPKNG